MLLIPTPFAFIFDIVHFNHYSIKKNENKKESVNKEQLPISKNVCDIYINKIIVIQRETCSSKLKMSFIKLNLD